MMASDLVDFPATNEALTGLACRLEAAFVVNPDPIACRKKGPLRAAASAMAAREHRIFFMVTPLLFMQAMFISPDPCSRRGCARNRMGPSRFDHESKCTGKAETNEHYLGNIYDLFEYHWKDISSGRLSSQAVRWRPC